MELLPAIFTACAYIGALLCLLAVATWIADGLIEPLLDAWRRGRRQRRRMAEYLDTVDRR